MPLISVVVPVYKVEPFLHQCVDSVLAQTFADFELILVDDGSPDNCGAMCDEYAKKDSRVRVIHKENGGLGNARNVGMDAASGKYILFLDSDDFWAENTLEVLFSEAEKNELEALVFSGEPFWDGMEPKKDALSYMHTKHNGIVMAGPALLRSEIECGEYYAQACMRFYRLAFLREHGLRFDEGIIHEDESFSFLACVFAARAESIGERLYKRRFRPGSIMTAKSFQKSAHGYAVAMEHILSTYEPERMQSVRDLYLSRFRVFTKIIYILYLQSTQMGKRERPAAKDARAIHADSQPVMKRVRKLFPELPKDLKLAALSLPLAYWNEIIKAKCKLIHNQCLHLVWKAFRTIFPKKKS